MFYFNLSVPFTEQRPNAHFILDLLLVLSLSGPFFGSYANSRIIGWDIQWSQAAAAATARTTITFEWGSSINHATLKLDAGDTKGCIKPGLLFVCPPPGRDNGAASPFNHSKAPLWGLRMTESARST